MSLIVGFAVKGCNVEINRIEREIESPHNELFGFESWRNDVWGHQIVSELGCKLLYSLKFTDILVFDEDIVHLKEELRLVSSELDLISELTRTNKEAIQFRINNALEHIRVSEKYIDKVGIIIS